MNIQNQILNSTKHIFTAFSIIARCKLRWLYILPFVIYFLVFFSGFALTNHVHDVVMEYVRNLSEGWAEKNGFFSFLFSASSVLTWIIIKVTLFLIFGIASGYITLIVLSPVYAWVSEKSEEELSGNKFPFNFRKFIRDIIRAIVIAIRNGIIQIAWTIALFVLSFVPLLNLITAPLLFIITAYFYGFSFLDYSFERLGLTMKESVSEVRKMKFAAIILGGSFLFLNMIPWIGPLLASLLSFNLVVAGTQLIVDREKAGIIRAKSDVLIQPSASRDSEEPDRDTSQNA